MLDGGVKMEDLPCLHNHIYAHLRGEEVLEEVTMGTIEKCPIFKCPDCGNLIKVIAYIFRKENPNG